jgi:hypothetical protein
VEKAMSLAERRWCLAFAAVVAIVTTIPYVLGYLSQGESWRFTGFVFAVQDGNSYIAKMLSGSYGAWLFKTPYTAAPQAGVLAFLPYILLGKLAAGEALHEQLVALFHLFRIGAIFLLIPAIYRFAGAFITSDKWRKWVTAMATLGGGLGWVLVLVGLGNWGGSLPLDFHSPETFGFLAVYGLPHLIVARSLLLVGLVLYLESPGSARKAWYAGSCFLLMGFFQPLSVVSALAVIAAHLLALAGAALSRRDWGAWRRWFWAASKLGIVASPVLIYNAVALVRDPYLQAWAAQNRILSPIPGHYLIAYGILLIPAIVGARKLLTGMSGAEVLPLAWVIIVPGLAYAPVAVQRRLPEGAFVALAVLAAIGLQRLGGAGARSRWLGPAVLALSLPTTLLLLSGSLSASLRPSQPIFRPAAEVDAFDWVAQEAEPGALVLAGFDTANAIPAWAPVRVLAGHGPESAGLAEILPQIEGFYASGGTPADRLVFLDEHDISFVFWGPEERTLGSWSPEGQAYLQPAYVEGDYHVYRVVGR